MNATAKSNADFRVIAMGSTKATIIWRDGTSMHVTFAKLAKLQARHAWAADF